MGGGVGGQKKKVVQNVLKHALVLESLKSGIFFLRGGQKKKVAQNVLKHALVLEFLKSDKIFFFLGEKV